jgi:hypothetical protein
MTTEDPCYTLSLGHNLHVDTEDRLTVAAVYRDHRDRTNAITVEITREELQEMLDRLDARRETNSIKQRLIGHSWT